MKRCLCLYGGCALSLLIGGCATTDERIRDLEGRNKALANVVTRQEGKIETLTKAKADLEDEVSYHEKRGNVLREEKQVRVQESQALRKGIRRFTDGLMQNLRDSYKDVIPVDYIGSEVLRRDEQGKEKKCLLVDLAHPLPSQGSLIGGRAYLNGPTIIQFCLLRPVEQGRQLDVVWMSQPLESKRPGVTRWSFEVPAIAQKGDLIGVYSPGPVMIPFDDVNTGNVMLADGKVGMNDKVDRQQPEGRNKRAYSFGCIGYLGAE